MTVLSAQTIRKRNLITPFFERMVHRGKSFGLSAAGYDVRYDSGPPYCGMIDILPPGGFMLAATVEHFSMPSDVMGIVHDKSSWARKGLTVQNTVIEPGWRGYLTLELTNHSQINIGLHQGEPIAQIVFHLLDQPTEIPYDGKYQDQKPGPQPAIDEE
jgi:dCTP deaminase